MRTGGLEVYILDNLFVGRGIAVALVLMLIQAMLLVTALHRAPQASPLPIFAGWLGCWAYLIFKVAAGRALANDELVWHGRGVERMHVVQGDLVHQTTDYSGKDGYVWIVGQLYAFGSPSPLLPILLNIVLYLILLLVLARCSDLMLRGLGWSVLRADSRRGRLLLSVFAAFPAVLLWVPTVLREVISWLAVAAVLYALVSWFVEQRLGPAAVALPMIALLYWTRDTAGTGVALAAVTALVFALPKGQWSLAIRSVLGIASAVAFIPVWLYLSSRFDLSSQEVASQTAVLGRDASTAISTGGSSGVSLLAQLFPRVLAGPLPWEWNASGGMILSVAGLAVWLLYLLPVVSLARNLKLIRERELATRLLLCFAIVAGVILIMVTFSAGNYGIVTRFRMMAVVALVPIGIVAWVGLSGLKRARRGVSGVEN